MYSVLFVCGCGAAARPTPRPPAPDFAPPALVEALFTDGTTFRFDVVEIGEEDDTRYTMQCRVGDVQRGPGAVVSRVACAALDGDDSTLPLDLPAGASPAGTYTASARGLRRDDRLLRLSPSANEPSWRCDHEDAGPGWPEDGRVVALCFRAGIGLVGGAWEISERGRLYRGRYRVTDVTPGATELPPGAAPANALVINEVSAMSSPGPIGAPQRGLADDWFEVVNATSAPVQLDDFVYTDRPGDFTRVIAFPTHVLAPGERWLQPVSDEVSGFRLNGTESLTIYRSADRAKGDEVAWDEGAAPAGGSWARVPDATGAFRTVTVATPGRPNR